jgi:hypothetical protein
MGTERSRSERGSDDIASVRRGKRRTELPPKYAYSHTLAIGSQTLVND